MPSPPIVGVGLIASPSVSLYKDTFPETTGKSSAIEASLIPFIVDTKSPIIIGFSGFPKLRQFVIASGLAPVEIIFLQH